MGRVRLIVCFILTWAGLARSNAEAAGRWWLGTELGAASSTDAPAQRGLATGLTLEYRAESGFTAGAEATSSTFDHGGGMSPEGDVTLHSRLFGAFLRMNLFRSLAVRPFLTLGGAHYEFTKEVPAYEQFDSLGTVVAFYSGGTKSLGGNFDLNAGGGIGWGIAHRVEGAVEVRYHGMIETDDRFRHVNLLIRLVFDLTG